MQQKKQKTVTFPRWPKDGEMPYYDPLVTWMAAVERAVVVNRRLVIFAVGIGVASLVLNVFQHFAN